MPKVVGNCGQNTKLSELQEQAAAAETRMAAMESRLAAAERNGTKLTESLTPIHTFADGTSFYAIHSNFTQGN